MATKPTSEAQLATLCVCSLVAPYIANPLYYTHPSSSYKYKYKDRHLGETIYTTTLTLFFLITNMIINKESISILHTFHCQSEILIPHQEWTLRIKVMVTFVTFREVVGQIEKNSVRLKDKQESLKCKQERKQMNTSKLGRAGLNLVPWFPDIGVTPVERGCKTVSIFRRRCKTQSFGHWLVSAGDAIGFRKVGRVQRKNGCQGRKHISHQHWQNIGEKRGENIERRELEAEYFD